MTPSAESCSSSGGEHYVSVRGCSGGVGDDRDYSTGGGSNRVAAEEEELGRCQSGSGGSGSESVAKVAQEAQSHLNVVA